MAQFDVHRNPNPETNGIYPFLVALQHDLLGPLETTVVAPMVRDVDPSSPITRLNPTFVVEGETVFLSVQEMAGVSRAALGDVVGSVASRRDEIIAALDLLFTGI